MTRSVLILDDEPSISMLMNKVVSRLGHDVECVERGEDAVELFKKYQEDGRSFSLLIMDLSLPNAKLGGFAALEAIRQLDPDVPAIASSGYLEQSSAALEHGFNRFLGKPFNLSELADLVEAILQENICDR